jgi:cell division ATPase FtsA
MRGLWRRRAKTRDTLQCFSVLDLGVCSIKALVVRRESDHVEILGRGHCATRNVAAPPESASSLFGLAPDGTIRDLDSLASLCEQAICAAEDATELLGEQKIVPDEVFIPVPTLWLRGAIGTGTVRRVALETGVTAEECVEPVIEAGRRAMRNLGRVTGSGQWQMVDATLITFGIDGHRVTDPLGFRGHVLTATVFVVAAPRRLVRALAQLADRLQFGPPYLVPEPLALAAIAPGAGLIVEVGAFSTGLCLADRGAPLAFGGIPFGGGAWTQAVADVFRFSAPRAEALKQAYNAEKLTPEGTEAVRKALALSLQTWASAVLQDLRSWNAGALPWYPDIYLCGGASVLSGVKERLEAVRWLNVLPFPHTPNIWMWDGSTAAQVIDLTESRWQPQNIVTLSTALWAIRDRGIHSPDGVLRASLGIH